VLELEAAERREHRRQTVRVLVDYVSREGVRCEYATTIGAGGLFVETDAPLPEGAALRLRFRLPAGDRLHQIEARVVWSHKPARLDDIPRPPGMGVEFTDAVAAAGLARELDDMPDWYGVS
jgi:uncharacterized protein (TIGR02266 family)